MSMLSAQIDELRKAAEYYDGSEVAAIMRYAADTIWQLRDDLQRTNAENAELREELAKARDPQRIGGQADPESFVYAIEQLREFRWQHATNDEDAIPYINKVAEAHELENAELREQMERLVTLLRVDCDIDASWDGLRRFWSIGLTENGCLMRDRACKAEAENVKLREQIHWLKQGDILHVLTDQEYIGQCERERLMQVSIDALDKDNAKLRELVSGLEYCVQGHVCDCCPLYDPSSTNHRRCESLERELGVEVDDG